MAAVLRGSRYLVGRWSKHVEFTFGKKIKLMLTNDSATHEQQAALMFVLRPKVAKEIQLCSLGFLRRSSGLI